MKTEIYIDTVSGEKLKKELYCYDNSGIISREYYHLHGNRHREDGPATIWYYDNGEIQGKWYYQNDKKHNKLGPAIICYNKNGEITREKFFINGIECDILQEMVIKGSMEII